MPALLFHHSLGISCWGRNINLQGLVWACVILPAVLECSVCILSVHGKELLGESWAVGWAEEPPHSLWEGVCARPGSSGGVLWCWTALRGNFCFLSWKLQCLFALSVVSSTTFQKPHLTVLFPAPCFVPFLTVLKQKPGPGSCFSEGLLGIFSLHTGRFGVFVVDTFFMFFLSIFWKAIRYPPDPENYSGVK